MLLRFSTRATHLWLMAGLLLAPLLFVPAPTAQAVGTLTATPTVAKIPTKSFKGKTTLSWNSGSADSVQIWIKKGSGAFAPTGIAGVSGNAGYEQLEWGYAYQFRLYTMAGQPLEGAPIVTVTVEVQPPKFDFGCAIQCITDVDLDVHGTYVDVKVKTNEPAGYLAQVSSDPPNPDGSCKSSGFVNSVWKPNPKATTFNGRVDELEPGTKYCVKIVAADANGNDQVVYRTFTTKNRYVHVNYELVKVHADGDNDGGGELYISFYVGSGAGNQIGEAGSGNTYNSGMIFPLSGLS